MVLVVVSRYPCSSLIICSSTIPTPGAYLPEMMSLKLGRVDSREVAMVIVRERSFRGSIIVVHLYIRHHRPPRNVLKALQLSRYAFVVNIV